MTTVTFIGGSQDLTRRVIDGDPPKTFYSARARMSGVGVEGAAYADLDLGFYEEVYLLATVTDREGKAVHVYVWWYDTDRTPSEIARLKKVNAEQSKSLSQSLAERNSLDAEAVSLRRHVADALRERDADKAEIARLNGTLSAVGNALTAKAPQKKTDRERFGCSGPCATCDRQYPERVR